MRTLLWKFSLDNEDFVTIIVLKSSDLYELRDCSSNKILSKIESKRPTEPIQRISTDINALLYIMVTMLMKTYCVFVWRIQYLACPFSIRVPFKTGLFFYLASWSLVPINLEWYDAFCPILIPRLKGRTVNDDILILYSMQSRIWTSLGILYICHI